MCANSSGKQPAYVDHVRVNSDCIRLAIKGDQESLSTIIAVAKLTPLERDWESALFGILHDEIEDDEIKLDTVEKRKAAELFGDYGLYLLVDCEEIVQCYSAEWEALLTKAGDSVLSAKIILGLQYWKKGEFDKAWPLLEKASEEKSTEAVTAIAWSYLDGYGKEESITKAMEWFQKIDIKNESESLCHVLDGDYYPIDQSGNWSDANLLIEILEKAGAENETAILNLAPGWEKIIGHPKPRPRWVTVETVVCEEVRSYPPKLGQLRKFLRTKKAEHENNPEKSTHC